MHTSMQKVVHVSEAKRKELGIGSPMPNPCLKTRLSLSGAIP